MPNGYVDYDFGIKVVPYLGAGIGYGRIDMQAQNAASLLKINDQASAFAWNLMAGLTLPYSETVDLTGGYRYIATDDFNYQARVVNNGVNLGKLRIQSEYDAHEVTVGIRVKF
jgi:opacity protein-like surface antigen